MSSTLEIVVRPKSGEDIRSEFDRFLAVAHEREWNRLKVLFGFAWGSAAYQDDWIVEVMSPSELKERVEALEGDEEGAISDDDLFVTIDGHGIQFTFCHENDIHVEAAPDDPILAAERDRYRILGWEINERMKKQESPSS